jgi:hypothetical protein
MGKRFLFFKRENVKITDLNTSKKINTGFEDNGVKVIFNFYQA